MDLTWKKIVLFIVGAIVMFGGGFFSYSLFYDKSSKQNITENELTCDETETNYEAAFDDYYLVDFAVIAKLISENSYINNSGVSGCELYDSDQNGIPELYMIEPLLNNNELRGKNTIFRIDDYKSPQILSIVDTGHQQDDFIYISDSEGKVYFCIKNGAVVIGEEYYVWNGYNMIQEIGYYYEFEYDQTKGDFNVINERLNINGKYEVPSKWTSIKSSLKLRELYNDYNNIISVNADDKIESVKKGLENHLEEIGCIYISKEMDIDKDGNNETVYAVNDYAQKWIDNNVEYEPYENVPFNCGFIPNDNVIIVLSNHEEYTAIDVEIVDDNEDITDISMGDYFVITFTNHEFSYLFQKNENMLLKRVN